MSMSNQSIVNIKILERDYSISCVPEERDLLLQSAAYLDQKMREIRAKSKTLGSEKIAIMVALNVIHELISVQNEKETQNEHHNQRLASLITQLERAL